ncbi:zonular occludens toxin domain-containing protein [Vibrio brasiliensis]|uniref:zonular occludens toxin domain-containing protein n=1 Tax=Vibrio brasiliensis TaxID=170652 RepID=UPI001EFE4C87|nr:zonular occludens toxin domain-containing protein [Vibrio brasiliensis]MCG9753428.1 zonular occludens toxin domain-containing protein [Vibrio brasiliensis]
MIYLRTGLPGASKSLNSLRELVMTHDQERPYYYNNIKLLMLDMDVAQSFSGWFYGWFFPRLKDKAQKRRLIKIMKPIHDDGEFLSLDDAPFLKNHYDSHSHFDTWLYWVKRVYKSGQLQKLNNILDCMTDEQKNSPDVWEAVKVCNLHFTQFTDPNAWHELPKKSVILIDECQQFFPPRPAGSRKPEAISKLETHRHGGYDLHFITQHPTLADQNLRKLVGRHIHFHNPFGGKRITRFEAPKCINPDDYHDKKQCTKKFTTHDANFYGVYWSAEIHTHKFKFPKMLFLGFFALLIVVGGLFYVYNMLQSKMNPDEQQLVTEQVEQSRPATSSTAKNADPIQDALLSYVENITKDVFITGSIVTRSGNDVRYDYVFYRRTDEAVFHPLDIGLKIEPITKCLANLVIGEVIRPITCDPFYIRVPVSDEEEEKDNDIKKSFLGGSDKEI